MTKLPDKFLCNYCTIYSKSKQFVFLYPIYSVTE